MKKNRRVRLCLVEIADFRKSDATIWLELESQHVDLVRAFEPDDVIAVRSRTGSQMMFLAPPAYVGDVWVYHSERLRLSHGTWNPLRLADYAHLVGLHLINLPTFEDILARMGLQAD